jgi:hypothetical protein
MALTPKQIIRKEPFKRILPYSGSTRQITSKGHYEAELPSNNWVSVPQEQLLAELHPSGHIVNNLEPKVRKNNEGVPIDAKHVAKIAVAMQNLIATKQKVHLTGNPIKFTLTEPVRTDPKEAEFTQFKQAWIDKNMPSAWSAFIESLLKTGDAAMYFYIKNTKLYTRNFSFSTGDVLLPHYDISGNLVTFGRLYGSLDDNGDEISMLDVYDKSFIYRYQERGFWSGVFLSNWKLISKSPHGFKNSDGEDEIPIVYHRRDDACWGIVQQLIDSLEEALSNMSESNRYYANLILFIQGSIESLPDRDERAKVLQGAEDTMANFLSIPDSITAQEKEIAMLTNQIMMGSFTVNVSPDSVKSSGDLPGITVKLLFSPATEQAMDSSKELDYLVDRMVMLFKDGYGIESGKYVQIKDLKTRGEIDVWVPQNDQELSRIINDALFSGAMSQETAAEKYPDAVNGEFERLKEQAKAEAIINNQIQNNE